MKRYKVEMQREGSVKYFFFRRISEMAESWETYRQFG